MEHFQPALNPRKQELLEARFLGARVSERPFLKFLILVGNCFHGCRAYRLGLA